MHLGSTTFYPCHVFVFYRDLSYNQLEKPPHALFSSVQNLKELCVHFYNHIQLYHTCLYKQGQKKQNHAYERMQTGTGRENGFG